IRLRQSVGPPDRRGGIAVNDVLPPASWACLRAIAPASVPPAAGLTPAELADRLKSTGRPGRVVEAESLEELAQATETGAVVLFVNAGLLWGDPRAVDGGEANHCVLARGLTDAGATIDDPARIGGVVVPADVLVAAWLRIGGRMLAVD